MGSIIDEQPGKLNHFSYQSNSVLGLRIDYIVDVLYHDAFDLGDLGFDFGEPAQLLGVIHAVLHLLLKLWPVFAITIRWLRF
jgi:hypothetical protein